MLVNGFQEEGQVAGGAKRRPIVHPGLTKDMVQRLDGRDNHHMYTCLYNRKAEENKQTAQRRHRKPSSTSCQSLQIVYPQPKQSKYPRIRSRSRYRNCSLVAVESNQVRCYIVSLRIHPSFRRKREAFLRSRPASFRRRHHCPRPD
jgi:hypothetical protein